MVRRDVVEAVQRGGFGEDQRIEMARDHDAVPTEGHAEQLTGDRLHRPHAGAAGQQQRAVDVEEHERLRRGAHGERL